jgi:type II secretory pathway predicted ATPase ExeA
LIGDVGTGKSILTKALLEDLGSHALPATVTFPKLDPLDFLRGIGSAWRFDGRLEDREDFYNRLPPFLEAAAAQDKRVLLVVDEAQTLSPELLTEIRTFASFTGDAGGRRGALNILLVGQEELNAILARPENQELRKKVSVNGVTQPLSDVEVLEYVKHHLWLAGSERAVFTVEAMREITTVSRGTPRLINTVCDLVLATGAQRNADTIGADIVTECAARLELVPAQPSTSRWRVPGLKPMAAAGGVLLLAAIAGYLVGSWTASERFALRISTEPVTPLVLPSTQLEPGVATLRIRDQWTEPEARSPEAQRARASEPLSVDSERPAPVSLAPLAPALPPVHAERPPPALLAPLAPLPPVMPLMPPPPRPTAPLPRPAPLADNAFQGREPPASSRPRPPTRIRDEPSAVPTDGVSGGEEPDSATDPAAIIDWVLRTFPARRD